MSHDGWRHAGRMMLKHGSIASLAAIRKFGQPEELVNDAPPWHGSSLETAEVRKSQGSRVGRIIDKMTESREYEVNAAGNMIVGPDIGTSKVVAIVGRNQEGDIEVVGIGSHRPRTQTRVVVNIETTGSGNSVRLKKQN